MLKRPLAKAAPKVSGGSTVGANLSCSKGKWAPDLIGAFLYQQPASYGYRWSRNGKRIAGANSKSILASMPGTYTCTVHAKNQAGSTAKTSAPHTVHT